MANDCSSIAPQLCPRTVKHRLVKRRRTATIERLLVGVGEEGETTGGVLKVQDYHMRRTKQRHYKLNAHHRICYHSAQYRVAVRSRNSVQQVFLLAWPERCLSLLHSNSRNASRWSVCHRSLSQHLCTTLCVSNHILFIVPTFRCLQTPSSGSPL